MGEDTYNYAVDAFMDSLDSATLNRWVDLNLANTDFCKMKFDFIVMCPDTHKCAKRLDGIECLANTMRGSEFMFVY